MNELSILIYTTVKDDATFKTLTGADSSDPRVYYAFPWEQRAISRGKPAYITWYVGPSGGVPEDGVAVVQIPDQTFIFDIWSRSPDQARAVEERLMQVLHSQFFTTTNYRTAYLTLDGRNEMAEEEISGTGTHINLRFNLGPIVRRTGKFWSTEEP
jgi:hypothetical protein